MDKTDKDHNGRAYGTYLERYGLYAMLCVWCGFIELAFNLERTLFLFFFERWKKYFEKLYSKVCRYKISTYICSVIKNKETMTTATITKTLKKVEAESKEYSLGFRRLTVLPVRVRRGFDLAANLETNWDGRKALENQKAFLGGLTEQEYINWLRLA